MRERHTCLEGGNYAASAASPHHPCRPSVLPPPPTYSTTLGGLVGGFGEWDEEGRRRDEAKGWRGMGGHSIDFVQDSRRRRRRGQPDPPLVVPTRLQHQSPTPTFQPDHLLLSLLPSSRSISFVPPSTPPPLPPPTRPPALALQVCAQTCTYLVQPPCSHCAAR